MLKSFREMEKKIVESKDHIHISYRCDKCRNYFEGIVKKGTGSVRLTCSVCGHSIVVYL
jgi:hypothetical protein